MHLHGVAVCDWSGAAICTPLHEGQVADPADGPREAFVEDRCLAGNGAPMAVVSALTLEEVLVRHPGLRLCVMHAVYPLIDDLRALLYGHPQVYLDISDIATTEPRPAFYRFLERIVEAGFGKRVMFGSDQMVWPEVIERAIASIEEAPFLSEQQKRDIFYDNAARFLRLSEEEIARHHGR